jgi:hypothetical protein
MAMNRVPTPGNCVENHAEVGMLFWKYPGPALSLAGAAQQTLAK